jgi:probable HAF family extracellular repeat protein
MSVHRFRGAVAPIVAACLLAAAALPTAAAAQTYTVEDLGTTKTGADTYALAINNYGQTVGYALNGTSAQAVGFKGGAVPLPKLPTGGTSSANGINQSGVIVGYAQLPQSGGGTAQHAYTWNNPIVTDLGALAGGTSAANAISTAGDIVGSSNDASSINHAVVWHLGALHDLGTLHGANTWANGLNGKGTIVGAGDTADMQSYHPFTWKNGRMTDIGLLPGVTTGSGEALGVNNGGTVTGWSMATDGSGHVFSYTATGGMVDLGKLAGGVNGARGNGINVSGAIVGASDFDGSGAIRAILVRIGTNSPVDLNTMLDPITGAGWVLESAMAINDNGQIVGVGLHNGLTRAFRLTLMQ